MPVVRGAFNELINCDGAVAVGSIAFGFSVRCRLWGGEPDVFEMESEGGMTLTSEVEV